MKRPHQDTVDKVFEISLLLKGLDGVLEFAGGVILIFVSPHAVSKLVSSITESDLLANKHNFITNSLLHFSHHISSSSITFGSIYLLLHGVVKIILVVAVMKEKLWAYPWLMAFLVIFIMYQIYRLIVQFTLGLTLLTLFDIFIVCLTAIEYKKHKNMPKPEAA